MLTKEEIKNLIEITNIDVQKLAHIIDFGLDSEYFHEQFSILKRLFKNKAELGNLYEIKLKYPDLEVLINDHDNIIYTQLVNKKY